MVPQNLTGLIWQLDNNVLTLTESNDLIKMYHLGWLLLGISSNIEIEHLDSTSDSERNTLDEKRAQFPVSFAPMILGHSLLGRSVLASSDDEPRLEQVHRALWPNSNLEKDRKTTKKRTAGRSRFRDSMLVSDSIRCGASKFVTNDFGILEGSERIRKTFENFDVISIQAATLLAKSRIAKRRKLEQLRTTNIDGQELPEWP